MIGQGRQALECAVDDASQVLICGSDFVASMHFSSFGTVAQNHVRRESRFAFL